MFAMRRLAVAVAATLVLSACSDSTGPDTVNTQVMATELAQLSTTFENNAAYQSMASLLGYFPGASFAPALRATMPIAPFSVLRGRDGGPALVAPRPELAPGEAQLVIPLDIRGKTYVFNPDSGHYVVSAAAGAPAAGIRIILYVVDLNTGQLLQPLQELGSVDLVDESNNTSDRLHVTLRLASTTISDYTITAVPGANSLRLTAAGYLRNATGTEQVDYTLMLYDDYLTGGGDFEYTLTAQGGAQVVVDIHDNGNETGTTLIEVTHGGNTVELTLTESATGATGQVLFNGTVVANITQTGTGDPVFTGANGHELTAEQQQNILVVFGSALILALFTIFGIFMPAFLFI